MRVRLPLLIEISALCAAALIGGCSLTPSEEDPTQVKLTELDARVGRIERSNQSVVEMAQRQEALDAETRQLRGRIEELENANEALKKQQRDLYNDLAKRVGQGGLASAGAGGPGPSDGVVPGAAGQAGVAPGAPVSASASAEQTAYNQAFDSLKSANYPAAITGFRDFIANYPHSDLLDNARYWMGEAYYVTRDFAHAAASFQDVLQSSPNSRKAPDAMLKLGYTQQELRQLSKARETLAQVAQRYPGTDAARLATERLQHLPNDAH